MFGGDSHTVNLERIGCPLARTSSLEEAPPFYINFFFKKIINWQTSIEEAASIDKPAIVMTLRTVAPHDDYSGLDEHNSQHDPEEEEEGRRDHDWEIGTSDNDNSVTPPTENTLPTVVFPPPRLDSSSRQRASAICIGIVLRSYQDAESGRFETTASSWFLLRHPKIMPRTRSALLSRLEFIHEILKFCFLGLTTCCPDQRCWVNLWQTPIRILLILPGLLLGVPMEIVTLVLLLLYSIPMDLVRGHKGIAASSPDDDNMLYVVYESPTVPPRHGGCRGNLSRQFLETEWDKIPSKIEGETRALSNETLVPVKIRFEKQQQANGEFCMKGEQIFVENENV